MWRFTATHRRAAAKGQTFISCTAPCPKALSTNRTPFHVRGTRRFSNPVSHSDLLTCDDASCLTRCHRAFVSNSCHFFSTPLSIPWRHIQSLRDADQPVRKVPSRDGYPRRSSHIVQRRVLRQNSCRTAPPSSCDATNELTDFSRFQSTFLSQIGQSRVGALRGAGPLAGRAFARNRAGVVAVARRNARPKADSER